MAKKGSILKRTIARGKTWKDAGVGAVAGAGQGLFSFVLGGTLGSIASAVMVGSLPVNDVAKTSAVVNLVSDAVAHLLIG